MKRPGKTAAKPKRQVPLKESEIKNFLAKYKRAWETRDADIAASLFTRDAQYQTGPFTVPISGREAIHEYWARATSRQEDVQFNICTHTHSGYIVAAEWTCAFKDASTGVRREIAGMFLADFYGEQVRNFREYWHSRSQ